MIVKPCAIVPSHNHVAALAAILQRLGEAGLPVFLIDDGSDAAARAAIAALAATARGVTLYRFEANQGKGGAVIKGFELAAAAGYTHALQVDADGQHDLAALPRLLSLSAAHPDALVLGTPVYDGTVPLARKLGRWITHLWVAVEILSPRIIDTMIGFRAYPLAAVTALLREERVGRRMDFDIEIAVRLIWRGVGVITLPLRVSYPPGNTSNFDAIRDNWHISKMHARLVFERLGRLLGLHPIPSPLGERVRVRGPIRGAAQEGAPPRPDPLPGGERGMASHWSGLAERGAYWGLSFLAATYRLTGRSGCMAAMLPVALYFHVTGREQRRASRLFLERAYAAQGDKRRPRWTDGLRHSLGFARRTVDTFAGWLGGVDRNSIEIVDQAEIDRVRAEGRGIVLIVSHFGNIELTRATLDDAERSRVTLLVHTRHARNYARLLRRFRPEAAIDTLQVTEVGPATVIALKEVIERGGWAAIAGDRTPVGGGARVSHAKFLGHDAAFPQGPYILAHLLECPVYLMFCLRENGRHRLHFERFADRVVLPRGDKEAALAALAQRYARRLEAYCLRDPFQWYNFFDFWAEAGAR